ncbi:MAG: DUF5333 domain-containing protein [Pseudomonadota bacterium]
MPGIEDTLLAVGIADEIRKNCPSISARLVRAYNTLMGTVSLARSKGYSDAEIDAYRNSDAEKDRLRAVRDAYLTEAGVIAGAPESYCALGRVEIEKGGQIGALLRMN